MFKAFIRDGNPHDFLVCRKEERDAEGEFKFCKFFRERKEVFLGLRNIPLLKDEDDVFQPFSRHVGLRGTAVPV